MLLKNSSSQRIAVVAALLQSSLGNESEKLEYWKKDEGASEFAFTASYGIMMLLLEFERGLDVI
jgi:hypothetical protein